MERKRAHMVTYRLEKAEKITLEITKEWTSK